MYYPQCICGVSEWLLYQAVQTVVACFCASHEKGYIVLPRLVGLVMTDSFPPTNPVFLVRLVLLLSLQDLLGRLLFLVSIFGHYTDTDAIRDYIENYGEYFIFNLEEKIFLVKKFVPGLLQSVGSFFTSKKSVWKIYEVITHPYVEAVVLLMFSVTMFLLLLHHSQVDSTVLTSIHWPKSIDVIDNEEKVSATTFAANTVRRAQSVLHTKTFPTSSNVEVNSISNVQKKKNENTEAVAAVNQVTKSSSIQIANDQVSFEQEKHQRDAAKTARLQQYPSSPNPLAKQPSRMRTLLRAATATIGLKRTNSMSSVTSETSTTSQATTSQPQAAKKASTTLPTIISGSSSPSSSFPPNNAPAKSQQTTNSTKVTTNAVSPLDSPQQQNKPKLLLRFDGQDLSTLRVREDNSPTAATEYPSTPGIASSPKNFSVNRTTTGNNNNNNNNEKNKVFLTPPRPPSSRPVVPQSPVSTDATHNNLQTPYSTVSTLTPDSQSLTMLQRHHSNENLKNTDNNGNSLVDCRETNNNNEFDYDASSLSEGTSYAGSENGRGPGSVMPSQMNGYIDDANAPPEVVMERSIQRPAILIGWRVMIPGYGTGLILSIKKKRFATTKFVVQLENDQIIALKLQRSKDKGNVPFHLLRKVR